jgi:predicted TIM-barrel fold metal-dependent hydrolase
MTEPRVIDGDGHIVEPDATFRDFLPAKFSSYAPRIVQYDDHFRIVVNDNISYRNKAKIETLGAPGQTTKRTDEPVAALGASDPAGRIKDLDLEGMERAVLFPTYGLMVQGVTDREPALALCRAINEWLAEYCRHDPHRLVGVATLPMMHPDDALAEARRAIEQDGFKAAFRRPEVIPGAPKVHDRAWDPLWAYLAEANVPIAIHPGLAGVVPYGFYRERFDDDFPTMHAAHFPVEAMMSLTSFIGFGILERHPTLRLALLESGAVWALPYAHRLDEHLEMFGLPGELTMRPSDYFRRQCYVAVEEAEPGLDAFVREYPDNVIFASDYPHADGTFPGAAKALMDTDLLDDATKWRVLRENAIRLYGLE